MDKELEALECSLKLYKMVESAGNGNGFNLNEAWKYHKNIKQALTTKSKKEQAFEIIIEKNVNIYALKNRFKKMPNYKYINYINNYGNYHNGFDVKLLTEQEFNLLKEVLNDNSQE